MDDGLILVNTERGDSFGFTAEKFAGRLWLYRGSVYPLRIVTRQQGAFAGLVERVLAMGYTVRISLPNGHLLEIIAGQDCRVIPATDGLLTLR